MTMIGYVACTTCGMRADRDPELHQERYGHWPTSRCVNCKLTVGFGAETCGVCQVGELGPIGDEEMPVARLIHEVHRRSCVPQQHDPACNTLRRLAEDQAQLAQKEREGRF